MDNYDAAIAYLTEHPDEICVAWNNPHDNPGGCLFLHTHEGYAGDSQKNHGGKYVACGCLTQIRMDRETTLKPEIDYYNVPYVAPTVELTKLIAADERIPDNVYDIMIKDLPVFAEWQRRLDKELNRA